MDFTYSAYKRLIDSLLQNGYRISTYKDWETTSKCAILRHDIDNDIEKALDLARIEKNIGG